MGRVLIAGGYGAFGSSAADNASPVSRIFVIAGRSAERARQAAERIDCHARVNLSSSVLNRALDNRGKIVMMPRAWSTTITANAGGSGPALVPLPRA
jgi:hypothetical protein